MKLTLPANQFAAAWLNVANATADDDTSPTLAAIDRTVVTDVEVERVYHSDSSGLRTLWAEVPHGHG